VSGLVGKEIRALLVPWLACMALLGAAALAKSRLAEPLSILVVVGGACALGALSLGHEYMAATLASMLAQPVGRVRVLAVKTAVLAVMLAALFMVFSAVPRFRGDPTAAVIAVATISGLCLAPWFTILTRSPLAGAVFGVSILGMIWVLLGLFTPQHFAAPAFWRIAAGLGVAGVALTWRGFMRLEAIDGHGPHVHMAWDEASAVSRVRRPAWAVVRKELGLQQIAFVLAAIYFVGAFRVVSHAGEAARDVFGGLTVLYSCVLALLIGAIASAEERQLGTLEWHQLLPMATWKQWALKAGTAIALSLMLGIAVPAVILFKYSGVHLLTGWYVAAVVLLTALGLYVSSLSSSSLRALLLSAAVPLVLLMIMAAAMLRIAAPPRWSLMPVNIVLVTAFVALLLALAFDNHRSGERSVRRVCVQLFILLGSFALELAVVGLVVRR
jgi:hypothetical protein